MKKLIGEWKRGVGYFFQDELISFYTFFTVILAECAYLWAFHEETWAFCLTAILLGYVFNVIVCAWLKGACEGTKLEVAFTLYYSFAFVMMFAAGCLFNAKMTIILTVIPFGITAFCIPLFSLYEDSSAGLNIFELAYEIS